MSTSDLNYIIAVTIPELAGLQRLYDTITAIKELSQEGADFNVRVNSASLEEVTTSLAKAVRGGYARGEEGAHQRSDARSSASGGGGSGDSQLTKAVADLTAAVSRMGVTGPAPAPRQTSVVGSADPRTVVAGGSAQPLDQEAAKAEAQEIRELQTVVTQLQSEIKAGKASDKTLSRAVRFLTMEQQNAIEEHRHSAQDSADDILERVDATGPRALARTLSENLQRKQAEARARQAVVAQAQPSSHVSSGGGYSGTSIPGFVIDSAVFEKIFESGAKTLGDSMRVGIESAAAGLGDAIAKAVTNALKGVRPLDEKFIPKQTDAEVIQAYRPSGISADPNITAQQQKYAQNIDAGRRELLVVETRLEDSQKRLAQLQGTGEDTSVTALRKRAADTKIKEGEDRLKMVSDRLKADEDRLAGMQAGVTPAAELTAFRARKRPEGTSKSTLRRAAQYDEQESLLEARVVAAAESEQQLLGTIARGGAEVARLKESVERTRSRAPVSPLAPDTEAASIREQMVKDVRKKEQLRVIISNNEGLLGSAAGIAYMRQGARPTTFASQAQMLSMAARLADDPESIASGAVRKGAKFIGGLGTNEQRIFAEATNAGVLSVFDVFPGMVSDRIGRAGPVLEAEDRLRDLKAQRTELNERYKAADPRERLKLGTALNENLNSISSVQEVVRGATFAAGNQVITTAALQYGSTLARQQGSGEISTDEYRTKTRNLAVSQQKLELFRSDDPDIERQVLLFPAALAQYVRDTLTAYRQQLKRLAETGVAIDPDLVKSLEENDLLNTVIGSSVPTEASAVPSAERRVKEFLYPLGSAKTAFEQVKSARLLNIPQFNPNLAVNTAPGFEGDDELFMRDVGSPESRRAALEQFFNAGGGFAPQSVERKAYTTEELKVYDDLRAEGKPVEGWHAKREFLLTQEQEFGGQYYNATNAPKNIIDGALLSPGLMRKGEQILPNERARVLKGGVRSDLTPNPFAASASIGANDAPEVASARAYMDALRGVEGSLSRVISSLGQIATTDFDPVISEFKRLAAALEPFAESLLTVAQLKGQQRVKIVAPATAAVAAVATGGGGVKPAGAPRVVATSAPVEALTNQTVAQVLTPQMTVEALRASFLKNSLGAEVADNKLRELQTLISTQQSVGADTQDAPKKVAGLVGRRDNAYLSLVSSTRGLLEQSPEFFGGAASSVDEAAARVTSKGSRVNAFATQLGELENLYKGMDSLDALYKENQPLKTDSEAQKKLKREGNLKLMASYRRGEGLIADRFAALSEAGFIDAGGPTGVKAEDRRRDLAGVRQRFAAVQEEYSQEQNAFGELTAPYREGIKPKKALATQKVGTQTLAVLERRYGLPEVPGVVEIPSIVPDALSIEALRSVALKGRKVMDTDQAKVLRLASQYSADLASGGDGVGAAKNLTRAGVKYDGGVTDFATNVQALATRDPEFFGTQTPEVLRLAEKAKATAASRERLGTASRVTAESLDKLARLEAEIQSGGFSSSSEEGKFLLARGSELSRTVVEQLDAAGTDPTQSLQARQVELRAKYAALTPQQLTDSQALRDATESAFAKRTLIKPVAPVGKWTAELERSYAVPEFSAGAVVPVTVPTGVTVPRLRDIVVRDRKQLDAGQLKVQELENTLSAQAAAQMDTTAVQRRLSDAGATYDGRVISFASNVDQLAARDPRFFNTATNDVRAVASSVLNVAARREEVGVNLRNIEDALKKVDSLEGRIGELARTPNDADDVNKAQREAFEARRKELQASVGDRFGSLESAGLIAPAVEGETQKERLEGVRAKYGEINKELKGQSQLLDKVTGDSIKAATAGGGFADRVINKLQTLSAYVFAGGIVYTISSQLRQAASEAIGLEADFARIQGVLANRSSGQSRAIGTGLMDAAFEFATPIRQSVQAGRLFAQTGADAGQTIEMTRASLAAQVGAGLEAQQASELLIAVENITNRQVKSFEILDRISRIESQYAVTAQDLSKAIQRAGSLATQLQPQALGAVDALDLIIGASTTIIERTRVSGDQAATSLRFIISRLAAPDVARALQDRFQIKLAGDTPDTLRPLQDILQDVADKYKSLRDSGQTVQAQQLLATFAGARQANVAAALLGGFDDALRTASRSSLAFGDTQERVRIQLDTFQSKMTQFNTAFTGFAASLFNDTGLGAGLKALLEGSTALLRTGSTGWGLAGIGIASGVTGLGARGARSAIAERRSQSTSALDVMSSAQLGARRSFLTGAVGGAAASFGAASVGVASTVLVPLAVVSLLAALGEGVATVLRRRSRNRELQSGEAFDESFFRATPFYQGYQSRALNYGLSTDTLYDTTLGINDRVAAAVDKEISEGVLPTNQRYNRTLQLLVEQFDATLPGFVNLGDEAKRTSEALVLLRESAKFGYAVPQSTIDGFNLDLDNLFAGVDVVTPKLGGNLRFAERDTGFLRTLLPPKSLESELNKIFRFEGSNKVDFKTIQFPGVDGVGGTVSQIAARGMAGGASRLQSLDTYARENLLVGSGERAALLAAESRVLKSREDSTNKVVTAEERLAEALRLMTTSTEQQRAGISAASYRLENQEMLAEQLADRLEASLNIQGRIRSLSGEQGDIGGEAGDVFAAAIQQTVVGARRVLEKRLEEGVEDVAGVRGIIGQLELLAKNSSRAAQFARTADANVAVRDRLFDPILSYAARSTDIRAQSEMTDRFGISFDAVRARSDAAQQLIRDLEGVNITLLKEEVRESARFVASGGRTEGFRDLALNLSEDESGAGLVTGTNVFGEVVDLAAGGETQKVALAKIQGIKLQLDALNTVGLGGFIQEGLTSGDAKVREVAQGLQEALASLAALGEIDSGTAVAALLEVVGGFGTLIEITKDLVSRPILEDIERQKRLAQGVRDSAISGQRLRIGAAAEQAQLQARLSEQQSDPRFALAALITQLSGIAQQSASRMDTAQLVLSDTLKRIAETIENPNDVTRVEQEADARNTFQLEAQAAAAEQANSAFTLVRQTSVQLQRRERDEALQLVKDLTSPIGEFLSSSTNFSGEGVQRLVSGVAQGAQQRLVEIFMRRIFSETGLLGDTLATAFQGGAFTVETALERGFREGVANLDAMFTRNLQAATSVPLPDAGLVFPPTTASTNLRAAAPSSAALSVGSLGVGVGTISAAVTGAELTRVDRSLENLDPAMRSSVEDIIAAAAAAGHTLTVFEGARSQERQDYLYEQGRSRPGPVVTWTRNSDHLGGRAVDFRANGDESGKDPGYAWLWANAESFGLKALGPKDAGHVSLVGATGDVRATAPISVARNVNSIFNSSVLGAAVVKEAIDSVVGSGTPSLRPFSLTDPSVSQQMGEPTAPPMLPGVRRSYAQMASEWAQGGEPAAPPMLPGVRRSYAQMASEWAQGGEPAAPPMLPGVRRSYARMASEWAQGGEPAAPPMLPGVLRAYAQMASEWAQGGEPAAPPMLPGRSRATNGISVPTQMDAQQTPQMVEYSASSLWADRNISGVSITSVLGAAVKEALDAAVGIQMASEWAQGGEPAAASMLPGVRRSYAQMASEWAQGGEPTAPPMLPGVRRSYAQMASEWAQGGEPAAPPMLPGVRRSYAQMASEWAQGGEPAAPPMLPGVRRSYARMASEWAQGGEPAAPPMLPGVLRAYAQMASEWAQGGEPAAPPMLPGRSRATNGISVPTQMDAQQTPQMVEYSASSLWADRNISGVSITSVLGAAVKEALDAAVGIQMASEWAQGGEPAAASMLPGVRRSYAQMASEWAQGGEPTAPPMLPGVRRSYAQMASEWAQGGEPTAPPMLAGRSRATNGIPVPTQMDAQQTPQMGEYGAPSVRAVRTPPGQALDLGSRPTSPPWTLSAVVSAAVGAADRHSSGWVVPPSTETVAPPRPAASRPVARVYIPTPEVILGPALLGRQDALPKRTSPSAHQALQQMLPAPGPFILPKLPVGDLQSTNRLRKYFDRDFSFTQGGLGKSFGSLADSALPLAGSLLGSRFGGDPTKSYSGEGSAIGGLLGSAFGPVGGAAGGLLGGFLGSRFKKPFEEDKQISALERIERNTRQQIEAIENQTRMMNLDSRFLNVPAGFVVPSFRPFGSDSAAPAPTITVEVYGAPGQDEREIARQVAAAIQEQLRGAGSSYDSRRV